MAEEILIKIELEKGDNEQAVDALTQKITGLTKANADLNKQNKELVKTGQENSKEYIENTRQIEINKQKINESQASRKNLIQTIIAEDDSIKALKIRNAELIKQRDQLSTKTDEGRFKISQINSELDNNNKAINDNSSALEKQKFNIGNYKSALDGLVPGLGGFVSGIEAATKAAWAFIATPLGAIIGAIGLAVAALTVYFKGSEEGQDRLTKITTILGVAMNKLMLVVEAIGEALFNGVEGLGSMTKKFGVFGAALDVLLAPLKILLIGLEKVAELTGLDKVAEDAVKAGAAIADLNDKIEARENELIVKRAETNAKVQALREEAIKQEGKLKAETIAEAIRLDKELAAEERKQHEDRLKAFDLEAATTGRLTEEQKKKRAELVADIINADAEGAKSTIRFQKELERLSDADIKAGEERVKKKKEQADKAAKDAIDAKQKEFDEIARIDKEIADAEKVQFQTNLDLLAESAILELSAIKENYLNKLISKEEFEQQITDAELKALETRRNFLIANGEETAAIEAAILDKLLVQRQTADAKELAASKKLSDEKVKHKQAETRGLQASIDAGVALAKEAFGENKAIAIAETIINTVRGIVRAIADYPFPYSAIVAAAVGALGTIQTAKIAGIGFANGGLVRWIDGFADGGSPLSGTRINSSHGRPIRRANGDNLLATVRTGEVILNERQQAALGGAETFRGIGVPGFAGGGGSFIGQTSTAIASRQAQGTSDIQNTIRSIMGNMPPIVVTVEDINAKQDEVFATEQKAQVI